MTDVAGKILSLQTLAAEPVAYIKTGQGGLIGHDEISGFGNHAFRVSLINRDKANDVIRRNHYSGSIVNNSYLHLGVFAGRDLKGVLQYGYAMNPASAGGVVKGTGNTQYLELNRMWISDDLPRNSESKAISYSLKLIRRLRPAVIWIQSFADERCGGRLGVVYQACSFLFCGSQEAVFWELDGVWYHNIAMTATDSVAKRKGAQVLQAAKDRAVRHVFNQYRYVKFLRQSWRKHLQLPVLPYPKPGATDA